MNFSHLSLKCYPTRANDHLKINNIQTKTKQNKATPGMNNTFFEEAV